jgi:hypothetical protein
VTSNWLWLLLLLVARFNHLHAIVCPFCNVGTNHILLCQARAGRQVLIMLAAAEMAYEQPATPSVQVAQVNVVSPQALE